MTLPAAGWQRNALAMTVIVGLALALHATLATLVAQGHVNNYWLLIIRYIGINIIMAASLNLVNGIAGQFSIGHAGFMAVGAYASASITLAAAARFGQSAPASVMTMIFVGSLVAGGMLAAGAGYLVGLPSLRLRGDYLAIVTLGFGEIIRVVILNVDALGGPRGLPGIKAHASVFWIWRLVGLTLLVLHRIARSDMDGRSWPSARTRRPPRRWASTPPRRRWARSRSPRSSPALAAVSSRTRWRT